MGSGGLKHLRRGCEHQAGRVAAAIEMVLVKAESGRDFSPLLDELELLLPEPLVEVEMRMVVDHVHHDVSVQLERRRLDRAALIGVGGQLLVRMRLLELLANPVQEGVVDRRVVPVRMVVILDAAVHRGAEELGCGSGRPVPGAPRPPLRRSLLQAGCPRRTPATDRATCPPGPRRGIPLPAAGGISPPHWSPQFTVSIWYPTPQPAPSATPTHLRLRSGSGKGRPAGLSFADSTTAGQRSLAGRR